MNQLTVIDSNEAAYRASTDAASLCKEIVVATATTIQGRKYVCVEGWQAIAVAHGCAAGSRDVERVDGGVRAIGEVKRMSDGVVIATAEGFVGEDEPTWYGGVSRGKTLPKRADYAIRAMAQTRAISRACRSAFAHVVVMMKAGLATTPAEEVPIGGFDNGEVIEHERSGPAPRTVLDGPHTSKTALKRAIDDLRAKVREEQTEEELDQLLDAFKRTVNQATRDWPELIEGFPDIAEDVGLKGEVERRRAELDTDSAVNVAIDSMKRAVTTRVGLEKWMEDTEAAIAAFDGADSRRFQAAYDEFETGLAAVETMNAG